MVFSSVAIFTIIDTPQVELTDAPSVPSAQEFLKMNCTEIDHKFPEFPSKEVADTWNTRMHECMNEQESLQLQTQLEKRDTLSGLGLLNSIVTEMEYLQQMSCDEIIQRNTEGEYLSKDNRNFARENTSTCNDKQESPIRYGHCSTILIIAQTQLNFYSDDPKDGLINRIHDCMMDDEFNLSDVLLGHQIQMCKLYQEIEDIPACNDIRITTQPFTKPMTTDELYPILVDNERKVINSVECSELIEKYDGKMHTVLWNVHEEFIGDAMDNCKDI